MEASRFTRYLRRHRVALGLGTLLLVGAVVAELAIPRLAQALFDQGLLLQRMGVVLRVIVAILAVALLRALLAAGYAVLVAHVAQDLAADLRREVLGHILTLSYGNLDRLAAGQGLARPLADAEKAVQAASTVLRWLPRVTLLMVGSLLLLLATNWALALAMLVVMGGGAALLGYALARTQPLGREAEDRREAVARLWEESLAATPTVSAHGRQEHARARFEAADLGRAQQTVSFEQSVAVIPPAVSLLIHIGLLVVLGLGGFGALAGTITIGQIVACSGYVVVALWPLMRLSDIAYALSAATVATQRIRGLLAERPDVAECAEAISLPPLKGRVAFEKVTFSFAPGEREPVLQSIDLVAEPGQTIAILGATAAGKSSLVNLIPRFYDVSSGRVTVDDVDVRAVTLGSLRGQIAIVAQHPTLFPGSIRDNIAMARPDASDDDIRSAAQAARLDVLLAALPPLTYATQVGPGGSSLSAELRHRVTLARAVLGRPSVLIVDGGAPEGDAGCQVRLSPALNATHGEYTCFFTAQRVADVVHADTIVLLRGRIAASGTHTELLQTSPVYRAMAQAQDVGEMAKGASS